MTISAPERLTPSRPHLLLPRTIPVWQVSLALAPATGVVGGAEEQAVLAHLVKVGSRIEVDLLGLARTHNSLALRLGSYAEECTRFQQHRHAGLPLPPHQRIERELVSAVQRRIRKLVVPLTEEYEALHGIPVVADLIDAVTGPEQGCLDARRLARLLQATYDVEGTESTVHLRMNVGAEWPEVLGGPPTAGEEYRHLVLHSNHAAWRASRVRRLVGVRVTATEIWPLPRD